MRIALVQHQAGTDHADNVTRGLEAVRKAAGQGATLKDVDVKGGG